MVTLYFLLFAAPAPPIGDATIASLNAEIEKWRKDVRFRSTFRLREGYAKSVEAGLREGIDPSMSGPPEKVFEATGVFHRKGDLIRYSLDYGRPPVVLQPHQVANPSFDEVSNGRIQVRYDVGKSGDCIAVHKLEQQEPVAGIMSRTKLNPLWPHSNPRFTPFKLWKVVGESGQRPTARRVFAVDGEHLEVVLTQDGDWKRSRRVRLRTVPAPPVITEIDETSTSPQGKIVESHTRLSDFRDCPGGSVARKVLTVLKYEQGRVTVREWQSQDVGNTPPVDADFVVTIAPTTRVNGLRNAPRRGTKDRRINIATITEADLDSTSNND